MEVNLDKRERSSNFTFEETDTLVALIEERKAIIECKKTDTTTNKTKEKEWENLTYLYNTKCPHFRTTKMLRSKWESLKKLTRKEIAAAQNEQIQQFKVNRNQDEKKAKNPWIDRILYIIGEDVNVFENDRNHEDITIYEEKLHIKDIIASTSAHCLAQDFPLVLENASADSSSTLQLKIEDDWDAWNSMPKPSGVTATQAEIQKSLVDENVPIEDIPGSLNGLRMRKKKRLSLSPTSETSKKFSDLVDKKLELIEMQIGILQKESEARMDMEKERHNMQMKILETELKLKEKLLNANNS